MTNAKWVRRGGTFLMGAVLGGLLVASWERPTASAQQNSAPGQANSASVPTDVARLKEIVPPNSHPMVEAGMFAANLWFAGEKKNWPLAGYFLNETRNRIRWEVHLNPGPKGADGNPVDMQSIFDGVDNGSITRVRKAIDAKDGAAFAAEYKTSARLLLLPQSGAASVLAPDGARLQCRRAAYPESRSKRRLAGVA